MTRSEYIGQKIIPAVVCLIVVGVCAYFLIYEPESWRWELHYTGAFPIELLRGFIVMILTLSAMYFVRFLNTSDED